MMIRSLIAAALLAVSALAMAGDSVPQVIATPELGAIQWLRNHDDAVARAREEGKPLLVLFTELPGCDVCRDYGTNVLSHPIIVEAIEAQFVPLAIANNVQGHDHEVLTSFSERALNNPVIRVVEVSGSSRSDIVPRLADDFSVTGLTGALVAALQKRESHVPSSLSLLDQEERGRLKPLPPAVFAMDDPSIGQEKLGTFRGVIDTRTGTLAGRPVLELTYDSSVVNFANLVREGRRLDCADFVFARSDDQFRTARRVVGASMERTDEAFTPDDTRSLLRLRASTYRAVPMTPLQALRVNAALATGGNPDEHLTIRQIRFRGLAAHHPDADWPKVTGRRDLADAFAEAEEFAASLDQPTP